ncbi:hypothetical protein AAX26_01965 [Aliarcobacter thereius]|uniref:hypothetical protein n=1 Tax=Aliarcobacter thereius TaxID=544718 RepID=UPI000828E76B|nr:hypothetical protein [Aliarcobacter thereius]OCL85537.1 hypothetical protein AAX26_01965 [Aliarcobacter thereius]
MKKLLLTIKRFLITTLTLYIFYIIYLVSSFPDYNGRSAFYKYSPDYLKKDLNGYIYKGLAVGNKAILFDKENKMIAFSSIDNDGFINEWFKPCKHNNRICFMPDGYIQPIELPPSMHQRLTSWLIVKVHKLDNLVLNEEEY